MVMKRTLLILGILLLGHVARASSAEEWAGICWNLKGQPVQPIPFKMEQGSKFGLQDFSGDPVINGTVESIEHRSNGSIRMEVQYHPVPGTGSKPWMRALAVYEMSPAGPLEYEGTAENTVSGTKFDFRFWSADRPRITSSNVWRSWSDGRWRREGDSGDASITFRSFNDTEGLATFDVRDGGTRHIWNGEVFVEDNQIVVRSQQEDGSVWRTDYFDIPEIGDGLSGRYEPGGKPGTIQFSSAF